MCFQKSPFHFKENKAKQFLHQTSIFDFRTFPLSKQMRFLLIAKRIFFSFSFIVHTKTPENADGIDNTCIRRSFRCVCQTPLIKKKADQEYIEWLHWRRSQNTILKFHWRRCLSPSLKRHHSLNNTANNWQLVRWWLNFKTILCTQLLVAAEKKRAFYCQEKTRL